MMRRTATTGPWPVHGWLRQGGAALLLGMAMPFAMASAFAQKVFSTPDAAAAALVEGLASHDDEAVRRVLGPGSRRLMPLDPLSEEDRTDFLGAWAEGHRIETSGTNARLVLANGWTLPIPLVHKGGGWTFDTQAGVEEMRIRRIGRNELAAIEVMHAFLDAQHEYATQDRNGDGVLEYARRFMSTPGKQDGLYWPTPEGDAPSPGGPLLETNGLPDGYHGYRYKILEAQGPSVKDGARSYLRGGRLVDGLALVAWPVRYGETGVKSFLINQDGVVYEKDLGPASEAIGRAMTRFDPDATWQVLPAP